MPVNFKLGNKCDKDEMINMTRVDHFIFIIEILVIMMAMMMIMMMMAFINLHHTKEHFPLVVALGSSFIVCPSALVLLRLTNSAAKRAARYI